MPPKETDIMIIEGSLDFEMGPFEDCLAVESFEVSLEVELFKVGILENSLMWRSLEIAWGTWLKESGEGARGFQE